jgi:hypothetical protein
VDIPASMLEPIAERWRESEHDVVRLGLFELLLGHACWMDYRAEIASAIHRADSPDLYHFLVTAVVASRRPELLADLLEIARHERSRPRLESLIQALELAEAHSDARDMASRLRDRLQRSPRGRSGP